MLGDEAEVLDVGGAAVPFPRADWVMDIASYETRGNWGHDGDPAQERFSAETWVQRDICDREPWPFTDDHFDFAVCSHTLEDVRDPVWVCAELNRVARAGYIEVPSRLEEQAWGFQGPWSGWTHHQWLIDVDAAAAELTFVFKPHCVHAPEYRFPAGFRDTLAPEQRISRLWWEGSFGYRERIFLDTVELLTYLADFVSAHAPPRRRRARLWR